MKLPIVNIDVHSSYFDSNNSILPTWRYLKIMEKGVDAFFTEVEINCVLPVRTIEKVDLDCINLASANECLTVITKCENLEKNYIILSSEIYGESIFMARGSITLIGLNPEKNISYAWPQNWEI